MPETTQQRKWRLVRESQEARDKSFRAEQHARAKAIRAERKIAIEARRERAYHEALVSDHNHDMDT